MSEPTNEELESTFLNAFSAAECGHRTEAGYRALFAAGLAAGRAEAGGTECWVVWCLSTEEDTGVQAGMCGRVGSIGDVFTREQAEEELAQWRQECPQYEYEVRRARLVVESEVKA
jgi:hypothetical protein